jgi:hypothetical protein
MHTPSPKIVTNSVRLHATQVIVAGRGTLSRQWGRRKSRYPLPENKVVPAQRASVTELS